MGDFWLSIKWEGFVMCGGFEMSAPTNTSLGDASFDFFPGSLGRGREVAL